MRLRLMCGRTVSCFRPGIYLSNAAVTAITSRRLSRSESVSLHPPETALDPYCEERSFCPLPEATLEEVACDMTPNPPPR